MTAAEVLIALRRLGVDVFADGDRLGVRGSAGLVTDQVRADLREHKAEILALLAEDEYRELLLEQTADLPPEERLIYLGYLQCRHCGRWLLLKEVRPDRNAQAVCIDRDDCREAAALANRKVPAPITVPVIPKATCQEAQPEQAEQSGLFDTEAETPSGLAYS